MLSVLRSSYTFFLTLSLYTLVRIGKLLLVRYDEANACYGRHKKNLAKNLENIILQCNVIQ